MLNAYIYDGLGSPFGRHAGALAPVGPDDLVAEAMRALVACSPFEPEQVEDVIQPLHRRRAPVKRTFRSNRYVRT